MIDREKVIRGLECIGGYRHMEANPCADCGYNECQTYAICVGEVARDALKLLQPRLLKWTEVDQFDVVFIEIHEDEEGLGEWSGYGSYERQGQEPGSLQFAAIGKSMRLVTDPENYNIYWRCWSSKPDRDQMESTPWKDPY